MEKSIVILGGGAVVNECFVPALARLGTENVVVVDPQATQSATVKAIRVPYREFLNNAQFGEYAAAIVALPNVLHQDAVERALRLGMDVLCEKPLALSAHECIELTELADVGKRILAVNMVRRNYSSVRAAQFAMDSGYAGTIERVIIKHGGAYKWPARSLAPFLPENRGVLFDMGIHYLDLARALLGPLTPIAYRHDGRGGVEANCCYELEASTGAQVEIHLSRTRELANTISLHGTLGTIVFNVDETQGARVVTKGHEVLIRPLDGGDSSDLIGCFVRQMREFFVCIGERTAPSVGGREAADSVALLEWAERRNLVRGSVGASGRADRERLPAGPAVVTGGSGFIGVHLVDRLVGEGLEDIRVPVRSPQSCPGVARYPVNLSLTDLLERKKVDELVRGSRYVFHLAYGRDGERRNAITIQGTKNVVEAAIAAGCEAVVVLSTSYVFGLPDGKISEDCGYQPAGGEYGKSKAEMEKWCLSRAAASEKTRIVILNPTCVYGPLGKTYTELPAKLAAEGGFCWIEDGRGHANYVYVTNLVDAILLSAVSRAAHGRRFIINDGVTTWRNFLAPFLPKGGMDFESHSGAGLQAAARARRTPLLSAAFRALVNDPGMRSAVRASRLGRRAAAWVRGQKSVGENLMASTAGPTLDLIAPYPEWLADLFGPAFPEFSSEQAFRVLQWKPQVGLREGQDLTAAYLETLGFLSTPQ